MKQKIIGILLGALMLFGGIGAVSAAEQSDQVAAVSTIPSTMSFNAVPDSISFNLNEYNVWKAASSPVTVSLTGNVLADVYAKLGGTPTGILFQNPYNPAETLNGVNKIVTGGMANGDTRDLNIKAQAPAGKAPGVYTDQIILTAISN